MIKENPPTVFISYSWDDEEHCKWVTRLACILSANGVDVLIDRYEVLPGNNLEVYMERGLRDSRWVICVCSDGYLSKMDNLKTGVGKEIKIIKEQLLSDFVIPVLKNNSKKKLPDLMQGKFYINFDDENYNENIYQVLELVWGVTKEFKPVKGNNPFNKEIVNQRILEAEIQSSTYLNPDLKGNVSFDYSNNSGKYTIGTGSFSFSTQWSKAGKTSIHVYNDSENIEKIALIKSLDNLEEFTSTSGLDFTSRARSPKIGDVVVWINTFGNIAITKILDIKDDTRGDNNDRLTFEYQIFTIPI